MKKVRLMIAALLLAAAALATMDAADPAAEGQASDPAAAHETAAEPEAMQVFAQVTASPVQTPKPAQTAQAYAAELQAKNTQAAPEPTATSTPEPIVLAKDEKELIARVVYAESRGEIFEGQVAVAQVVINRYLSGQFGSTLKRVVFAPHQFAVSKRFNEENVRAVETAIADMPYPETMYFFRASKSKNWRNFAYYCRIGGHSFYLAGK